MKTNQTHVQRLVGTAILAALVIVLQFFVSIPIGTFYITLTLIPIMIGAILFGPATGAVLGAIFGVAVGIQVVTGAAGVFSFTMFEMLPAITLILCVLKGAAAGFASGAVYRLLAKKERKQLATVLAAVVCPITNTGIFCIGLVVFYKALVDSTMEVLGFTNLIPFLLIGMIGLNFVVEFAVNVLLIPVVIRIINIVKKKF